MLTSFSPSAIVTVTGPPRQSRPDAVTENVWPAGSASMSHVKSEDPQP